MYSHNVFRNHSLPFHATEITMPVPCHCLITTHSFSSIQTPGDDVLFGIHIKVYRFFYTLHWRHNGRDNVSNHQPHDCLLNRLFRRRSMKTPKPRVTGLCVGNSPGTGEFPAQMSSNAENVSIWWRHHGKRLLWPGIKCELTHRDPLTLKLCDISCQWTRHRRFR